MPIPQKTFFLVERASCPFQNLIKRIFARGLIINPCIHVHPFSAFLIPST
ncbi:hypothetical protein QUB70_30965 [Microcoleus sp. A003_D6]